ncbi:MAG: phosphoserine phosphatase SerB [Candidatus Micrarchaeota archaeon]
MGNSMKKLAAFDFDSTLIEEESIDEIARLAGQDAFEEISKITKMVNDGKLGIREGMKKRVAKFKGIEVVRVRHAARGLHFKKGFSETVRGFKKRGYVLAIISGGFGVIFDELKKTVPEMRLFDEILCNELGVSGGRLDGTCEMKVCEEKGRLLKELAARRGVELRHVVAVGDGALDRTMLEAAGLGICLAGNPVAEKAADVVVRRNDLGGMLAAVLFWEKVKQYAD